MHYLARQVVTPYTLEELETELDEIRKQTRYSFLVTMLFGAIGAAGFAIFLMAHGKKLFVPLLLEFSLNVFAGA